MFTAAYGLRVEGARSDRWLAVSGAGEWPTLSLVIDDAVAAHELIIDPGGHSARVPAALAHSELVHPMLQRLAGRIALARGDDVMHAGMASGATGGWALIGPRGAGKSTLLAALAAMGTPIITDDVTIFRDEQVMAGPRCIDLRTHVQPFGDFVNVRPDEPRKRISLPPIAAEHTLAGIIHLEWSAHGTSLDRLPVGVAMERVLALHRQTGFPHDQRTLLTMMAIPAYALRRPPSWEQLDVTASAVAELIGRTSLFPCSVGRTAAALR